MKIMSGRPARWRHTNRLAGGAFAKSHFRIPALTALGTSTLYCSGTMWTIKFKFHISLAACKKTSKNGKEITSSLS
jgi:hypothetical protein